MGSLLGPRGILGGCLGQRSTSSRRILGDQTGALLGGATPGRRGLGPLTPPCSRPPDTRYWGRGYLQATPGCLLRVKVVRLYRLRGRLEVLTRCTVSLGILLMGIPFLVAR